MVPMKVTRTNIKTGRFKGDFLQVNSPFSIALTIQLANIIKTITRSIVTLGKANASRNLGLKAIGKEMTKAISPQ
ncbi:hypothetical protein ES705_20272 [subsurface metagenome]